MRRLRTLLLNNNSICRFASNLGESLPHLEWLILTKNKISALSEIDCLTSLGSLRYLSLVGNEVSERQFYRLYVVYKLPQLRMLDFKRIKDKVTELPNAVLPLQLLICYFCFVCLIPVSL